MINYDHDVVCELINPYNVLKNSSGPKEIKHNKNLKAKLENFTQNQKFSKVNKRSNSSK